MWRNRNVWIILSGEFIAGVGLWGSIIANLEFMQAHVPSDFMKSLILVAGLLAGVAIGPYAGRVIDQQPKKRVLFWSGVGRMISVCFMFVALALDSVLWMVCFAVALQISAAFYFPTLQALIPAVVDKDELLSMNGVHMNMITLSRIVGTALAGFLLTVVSLYGLYAMSLVAYALLLGATLLLQVDEPRQPGAGAASGKPKASFKEVFPLLKEMPLVLTVLLLTLVPTLFIGSYNLMVINISEALDDSSVKGLLYAVEGISFLVAAFFVKKITGGRNLYGLLLLFAVLVTGSFGILWLADHTIVYLLAFILFGLGAGCFFPITATMFQTLVPKEMHGRFFSFRNMMDRVAFQVILLASGLLLDTVGLHGMVLLFGVVSLGLTILYALRRKESAASASVTL